MNSDEILLKGGNVWLGPNNFGGDRDHDVDPGNYSKEIWDRDSCTNFADNSRSCPRILIDFFRGVR